MTESTFVLAGQCKNFLYRLASTKVVNFTLLQFIPGDRGRTGVAVTAVKEDETQSLTCAPEVAPSRQQVDSLDALPQTKKLTFETLKESCDPTPACQCLLPAFFALLDRAPHFLPRIASFGRVA